MTGITPLVLSHPNKLSRVLVKARPAMLEAGKEQLELAQ